MSIPETVICVALSIVLTATTAASGSRVISKAREATTARTEVTEAAIEYLQGLSDTFPT